MKPLNPSSMKTLVAATFLLGSIPSFAQSDARNGGNGEIEFTSVTNEIVRWMEHSQQNNALEKNLAIPAGTGQSLLTSFKEAIRFTRVEFTDEKIMIGESEKICINSNAPISRIVCNQAQWSATRGNVRYGIVLHEYFGILGIEKNDGNYSQYPHSSLLIPFVYEKEAFELRETPQTNQSKPRSAFSFRPFNTSRYQLDCLGTNSKAFDFHLEANWPQGAHLYGKTGGIDFPSVESIVYDKEANALEIKGFAISQEYAFHWMKKSSSYSLVIQFQGQQNGVGHLTGIGKLRYINLFGKHVKQKLICTLQ